MQALTNAQPESTAADGPVEIRKKQFREATQKYFAMLSSIEVQLRRQNYAQEEADIRAPMSSVPPDPSTETSDSMATVSGTTGSMTTDSGETSGSSAYSTVNAVNALEISWINTRKDPLNKEKEAELWAAARGFMERVQQSRARQEPERQNGEHENMQVD